MVGVRIDVEAGIVEMEVEAAEEVGVTVLLKWECSVSSIACSTSLCMCSTCVRWDIAGYSRIQEKLDIDSRYLE